MPHVVTKSDLVQVAAKAGNLSKAAAGEAVNAVFDAIVENVARGKRVTVVGFGTFLPRKRKARAGRSPVNGKEIKIDAKTLPAFAAMKTAAWIDRQAPRDLYDLSLIARLGGVTAEAADLVRQVTGWRVNADTFSRVPAAQSWAAQLGHQMKRTPPAQECLDIVREAYSVALDRA